MFLLPLLYQWDPQDSQHQEEQWLHPPTPLLPHNPTASISWRSCAQRTVRSVDYVLSYRMWVYSFGYLVKAVAKLV